MRDLRRSLLQHDTELLHVIAENWGQQLAGLAHRPAAEQLAAAILAADWPAELDDLPRSEQEALRALLAAGGHTLADPFWRRFGPIRPIGPGRLSREEPWLNPAGPAEALWYRGLLFRAFEQTDLGGQEIVYLPDDLREQLPPLPQREPDYRLTAAAGRIRQHPAAVGLADDCCTLLAYLQCHDFSSQPQPELPEKGLVPFLRYKDRARLRMIWELAADAALWQAEGEFLRPAAQEATRWLEASGDEQATVLARAWLDSNRWNDLWHVPTLRPESTGWSNDPRPARELILGLLANLEANTWWSLESLAPAVKAVNPDFERTAGDYDAWYIREQGSDRFLMGYQHWDQVEGALLRFLVSGPLYWLGLVELGRDESQRWVFRPSPAGLSFARRRRYPAVSGPEQVLIQVRADARIQAPVTVNRLIRFQLARLVEWEPIKTGAATYRYRLSPASLERAQQAGIPLDRAVAFLTEKGGRPLPDPVQAAVASWQQSGVQIRMRALTVLQVRDPAVLDRLRAAPQVRRLLGEALGPLAVAVRTADWERVVAAIAELGLLTEVHRGD